MEAKACLAHAFPRIGLEKGSFEASLGRLERSIDAAILIRLLRGMDVVS